MTLHKPAILLALTLAAAGCSSSSSSTSSTDDAGTTQDDAAADAGADAGPALTSCGDPPLGTAEYSVLDYGAGDPLQGATFSSAACPGYTTTSDKSGYLRARVSTNLKIVGRFQADGHLDTLTPEQRGVLPFQPVVQLYKTADASKLLPGFAADKGTIYVYLVAGGTTCNAVTDATVSVVGQPGAQVSYMKASYPNDPAVASTTGAVGPSVVITGVAPGTVTLDVKKTGCTAAAPPPETGNFQVEANAVSIAFIMIRD